MSYLIYLALSASVPQVTTAKRRPRQVVILTRYEQDNMKSKVGSEPSNKQHLMLIKGRLHVEHAGAKRSRRSTDTLKPIHNHVRSKEGVMALVRIILLSNPHCRRSKLLNALSNC
ncbi:hypothetical protein GGR54DRAFT_214889 [Hypoxylon sp. NC1633]|nr:hypothetical protein GGR54DRAFT_214889 [Hypoxylon sp. NC1633]